MILRAGIALATLLLACEREAPPAPAPPPEPAPAPEEIAEPIEPEVPEPPRVALGQPLSVDIAPAAFELVIEASGEYDIEAGASEGANAAMHLYLGDALIEEDDDGGEAAAARIVRFLEPGTYSVRVHEEDARPFTASVTAERLEAPEPAGALTIGPALDVVFPVLPELRRAENDRDASREVTLTVEREGEYACVARMDNGRLARMQLIRDDVVLASDEQRFTELAASITQRLAPGTYRIRVWDAEYRGDMRATIMCDPAGS